MAWLKSSSTFDQVNLIKESRESHRYCLHHTTTAYPAAHTAPPSYPSQTCPTNRQVQVSATPPPPFEVTSLHPSSAVEAQQAASAEVWVSWMPAWDRYLTG